MPRSPAGNARKAGSVWENRRSQTFTERTGAAVARYLKGPTALIFLTHSGFPSQFGAFRKEKEALLQDGAAFLSVLKGHRVFYVRRVIYVSCQPSGCDRYCRYRLLFPGYSAFLSQEQRFQWRTKEVNLIH